jgi:predicted Zn finger-like uncharacterized protein
VKFYCPKCRVTFTVSDERIPEGKGLKVLCPRCRTPVDRKDDPGASDGGGTEQKLTVPPPVGEQELQDDSSAMEVFEEGAKVALLYLSEASRTEKMSDVLHQLDYHVSVAGTAKTAIKRLDQSIYQLVILDEAIDVHQDPEIRVLHHLQLQPMHVRRQFFLCLLSENLPTLDRLVAFRLGVDLIINLRDLEKSKLILVRTMKDHKTFYKAFNSELERKV